VSLPAWQIAVGAQAALAQVAWVGMRLMTSYRALELGADTLVLGVVAAAFALPALLGAMPLGRLADHHGGARLSFAGMLIAAAGGVLVIGARSPWLLLVGAGVVGLGNVAIMIGQQSFVALRSLGGSPDSAFGNLTAAASIGQLLGPPVVTFAAATAAAAQGTGNAASSATVGLIVSTCVLVLAMPMFLVLRQSPAPARLTAPPARTAALLRTPGLWRSLVVSAAVLVSVDLLYAFIPAWATDQGIPIETVGMLLTVRAAVSLLTRIGLQRLVLLFGRRNLIAGSMACAAAGLAWLPFTETGGAFIAMIGLGLGLGIPQPLTMSWVVRITPPAMHGAALGLRMSANRLAQITLPVSIGALAAPLGAEGVFLANAALLGLALLTIPRQLDDS
jgi:MFS family permease